MRAFLARILDFDSRPYLERTTCPLLAFFGELDVQVPASENRARMEAAVAGNRDATFIVLPQANHLFLRAQSGASAEIPGLSSFEPAYFASMARWLRARIALP